MESLQLQHTNRQYEEELRAVRADLLKMGGLVEHQIAEAMQALVNRDGAKARETIARELQHRIKTLIGVSARVDVGLPDSIERTLVGKARRVVDKRPR